MYVCISFPNMPLTSKISLSHLPLIYQDEEFDLSPFGQAAIQRCMTMHVKIARKRGKTSFVGRGEQVRAPKGPE